MQARIVLHAGAIAIILISTIADAKINTVIVHNRPSATSGDFKLKVVPPSSAGDAATTAEISIINGTRDANGGDVDKLRDGRVPTASDQPSENFFFAAGTEGGRLMIDLGRAIDVEQVNTYSWHANTRGPQVYALYASDGTSDRFNRAPEMGADPERSGWKLVARVDTRPTDAEGEPGGQYGVSIFDSDGPIGHYRYLLFNIVRTEDTGPFGNTFYSEIDVVAGNAPEITERATAQTGVHAFAADDGKYQITIDTSETPDLREWATQELAPVVREWYPRIVKLLPSERFEAPRSFNITFSSSMRGVAATAGTRVHCAADWFRQNLKGEAKGAIVHELVHVVQQYRRARRSHPDATRPPGWLVEGIADYIRWFLYEPQSRGAVISQRNLASARYDASYRISGNFLNWVTEHHDRDIVRKLNAALREGRYDDELWSDYTNRTIEELDNEWRRSLERTLTGETDGALATATAAPRGSARGSRINALSDEEKSARWRLLFNGRNSDGWHSFGSKRVGPGWQVDDEILTCANPKSAGDLCTDSQYDWFELRLEYRISEGGNSGIMYHVTDDGDASWATGPEFQLQDNAKGRDLIKSGWLYALYEPATDPKTKKPIDATKPAGEWNQVTLLITPEKCVHEINGVKYLEYVLGGDNFRQRVAGSKFGRMPHFAKTHKGYIALQGDHGQVSFRNIKIRPIAAAAGDKSSD